MIGQRFLSVDPVTAYSPGGAFNQYWYANDNPYVLVDPDGRTPNEVYLISSGELWGGSQGVLVNGKGKKENSPDPQPSGERPATKGTRTRAQVITDAIGSLLFGTAWNRNKKAKHPTHVPDAVAHRNTMVGLSGAAVAAAPDSLVKAGYAGIATASAAAPREAIYAGCVIVACTGAASEEAAAARAAHFADLMQRTEQEAAISETLEQGLINVREWFKAAFFGSGK